MVIPSGAHCTGVLHCSSFSDRFYNFNNAQDPSVDPRFAVFLKTKCPSPNGATRDPTVALEFVTLNRLDNKYYMELRNRRGLLTSDQMLMDSPLTSNMVMNNARNGAAWAANYAKAMVHLGSLDVLGGTRGEIRRPCSVVN